MSAKAETQKEVVAEEPEEVESKNPYIVTVQNRSRNLKKRYAKALALEQEAEPGKKLNPNQRDAIREKDSCKFASEELDKLTPSFQRIEAQYEEERKSAVELDNKIISTILLLPVYLSEERELRLNSLTSKAKLTAENIETLCSLRDYIIPTTIGTPLIQAIGNSTHFLKKLTLSSPEQSPLGPTFAELRQHLQLLISSDALVTLPKPPKASNKQKSKAQKQKKEPAPASAPAPETPAQVTPLPAPTAAPQPETKPQKQPKQKQNPHVYTPSKQADAPAAPAAPAPSAPVPAKTNPPRKEAAPAESSQFKWTPGSK